MIHLTRFYAIQRNIFSCKTTAQISGCRQWIANYENAGGKEGARLRKIAATQERIVKAREALTVRGIAVVWEFESVSFTI